MPYADPLQRKAYNSIYYQTHKETLKTKNKKNWLKKLETCPEYDLYRGAKTRAVKAGLGFSITVEDITIPETCPYLDIPITRSVGNHSDNSPTLDRINPDKGYTLGNVEVVSFRANRIKNDGFAYEHRLIADRLDALNSSTNPRIE
jgi:hypothetical protein